MVELMMFEHLSANGFSGGDVFATDDRKDFSLHLGRDPEMRYTPGGQAVTSLSVGSGSKRITGPGGQREETEWFSVLA